MTRGGLSASLMPRLMVATRQILHVDMDAFFAAVEQRDDPSLMGRPVVVGGAGRRGVVAAASYEARRHGLRSAMPMVEALRRCPEAVVVAPRHRRYAEVSADVFEIFRRYSPQIEGLSLDEAFIDVTASRALFGDGRTIALRIKSEIRDELALTASAGVAPSKFVAKIASDIDKPDGLVVVDEGEVESFLAALPIERMWGVGKRAADRLHGAGYHTMGDLGRTDPHALELLLGSWGRQIALLATGEDPRPVVVGAEAKSLGCEDTYERDLHEPRELERRILGQSTRVAHRLVRGGLWAQTVVVKIKYADFSLKTRQARLAEPVCDTDAIYEVARTLLAAFPRRNIGVRLTGVTAGELSRHPAGPQLFPDARTDKRRRLQQAVSKLNHSHGVGLMTRAALLGAPRRGPEGLSPSGTPPRAGVGETDRATDSRHGNVPHRGAGGGNRDRD